MDTTEPDSYPGFMVAEGNIYSCRYGIHHQSQEEFDPPKAQVFATLLARNVPGVTSREGGPPALRRLLQTTASRLSASAAPRSAAPSGPASGVRPRPRPSSGGTFMFQNPRHRPRTPLRKQDPGERWIGCDDEGTRASIRPRWWAGGDVVCDLVAVHGRQGPPYHYSGVFLSRSSPRRRATWRRVSPRRCPSPSRASRRG